MWMTFLLSAILLLQQSRNNYLNYENYCVYGTVIGGLGQILYQLVEDTMLRGDLHKYYTTQPKSGDTAGELININFLKWLHCCTPFRFSLGWMNYFNVEIFDPAVARRLVPMETFVGFNGQSYHTFKKARKLGYNKLELISANSHVKNIMRQQVRAFNETKIGNNWLNETRYRKTLCEYSMADIIYVISSYAHNTFIAEGFPPDKLRLFNLVTESRFKPTQNRVRDGIFRIIYTGAVSSMKGVPILIEAFYRFRSVPAELILVGSTSTRTMKRYMKNCIRKDPRICMMPGDPLPHLLRADVYVHPSYTDGFGFAPMEAIACGVPVIVTDDTGMKEHVKEGANGYIIPTGNYKAILDRLEYLAERKNHLYREHSMA